MVEPILDWGTYNGASTLRKARLLGLRLTEIPPGDFMRKSIGDDYFSKYREEAEGFTTITAHGPYYALVGKPEATERSFRAHSAAIKKAELAGAEVYNIHIGRAGEDRDESIAQAVETIKKLLKDSKIFITLETTYSPKFLGSIEDIKKIIEEVGSDRVGISLQLENDFIREKKVYQTGNFHAADAETDAKFWEGLLKEAEELFGSYVSLRFSQVTGMYLRKKVFVKKRTPLGMGYPSLDPLVKALAKFIVNASEAREIHLIYTGPPETKYKDTILLYYHLMREVAEHL